MRIFLLIPVLFFELITKNIVKSIALSLAILLFFVSKNVEPKQIKINHVYSTFIDSNNKVNYVIKETSSYEVKTFDKTLPILKGSITYSETSELKTLSQFGLGFIIGFLIVSFFMGLSKDNDDISWEFYDCWLEALSSLIYCELEDGKYYYMILGRLIYISERLHSKYRSDKLITTFNIYGIRDILNYPKYNTKTEKRNSKLNSLGIK